MSNEKESNIKLKRDFGVSDVLVDFLGAFISRFTF